ncbi:MAG: LysR family transcriptional regulator [Verrucomicrobia bacterium]|nr:LysR family transcriptional regulator [Verrucomicrobiota bacterium]
MPFLNYHHLRYFRLIARDLNLTQAAKKLNLSAPALSLQLKQLEESLGHQLFERRRSGLLLTEAGRIALDYAEAIGRTGEELLDVMQHRPRGGRQVLRVGAVATLSRNFQLEFLRPVLHRDDVEVVIRSSGFHELLLLLHSHQVDLVLSNQPARRDSETHWHSHLLAEQPVSLVGTPPWKKKRLRFPEGMRDVPVILPSQESNTRAGFDRLLASAGVRPRIVAEVDDMAMIRLLAREGEALALVPLVVVQSEIQEGILVETHRIPQVQETFYAVTPSRRFPNPLVGELVHRIADKKPAVKKTRT